MDGALTGTLIDGRYRVGSIVGAGGFGTVYAAVHVGLVGRVALKVPRIDDLAPQDASRLVATFLEEGRLLKRLRHPSIVTALDVGVLPPDGAGRALPYLVLEWCDGVTLKDWLAQRAAPPSRDEAWALLRSAFEAIGHAHEHGIAHRDVKPANILLEQQRGGLVPRVIDFGIAKVVAPTHDGSGATRTTSDRPAYTPRYAAPEQLLGLRSGPQSDVFALALVLLETLLGRPVFESNEAARAAVADADLPTPRKLGLDLGPWNEVLERALSWRASDRHADAHALVRALDGHPEPARTASNAPARPSHPPSIPPSRPPARRDEAPSVTAHTGAKRSMAHALVDIGGRKVFLALHTKDPPSDAEWGEWTQLLDANCRASNWDLATTSNFVVTDGGAPNTAQRTAVNVLIAQGKTMPAVALVTASRTVRLIVRGFSIFNPRIRVFGPAEAAAAVAHAGLDEARLHEVVARCARLEADVLGAGTVETLGVLTRTRS